MPYPYQIHNSEQRKITLNSIKRQKLDNAWDAFCEARNAFALNFTRDNYNALAQAGSVLIDTQTELGVWVIHPANARPGLNADDPRIN